MRFPIGTARTWEGKLIAKSPRYIVRWTDGTLEKLPLWTEHNLEEVACGQSFVALIEAPEGGRVSRLKLISVIK